MDRPMISVIFGWLDMLFSGAKKHTRYCAENANHCPSPTVLKRPMRSISLANTVAILIGLITSWSQTVYIASVESGSGRMVEAGTLGQQDGTFGGCHSCS
ncbi:hypothetical protein VTK26DRAFT_2766 [Humicola hyalothermophila]